MECLCSDILVIFRFSVHIRPTESESIFTIMIFGRDVDYPLLLKDHDALFSHIKKVTNRSELEFGEIKWITEWRLV